MGHPLLARLASPDADERARACGDAVEDPAAVVLIDALAGALADLSERVARAASDALAALGRRHDVGAPLRRALRGRTRQQRWQAARAVARLEPPGPVLLPALVEALGSRDRSARWEAARLLVDTGRLHGEVLPLLLGLARGGDPAPVRAMAAHCLRELAPDDPECAAALLDASRDPDPGVRRAALTALGGLLDPPAPVVLHLRERVRQEPDPASRHLAAAALDRLLSQKSAASSE